MEKKPKPLINSRRAFVGSLATGITAGMSMLSTNAEAKINKFMLNPNASPAGADDIDKGLKKVGGMQHPVAYDVSQAVHWGVTWSNVYYMTNEETGTANNDLGLLLVLRHDGIMFSFKSELIEKYNLGEALKGKDPKTGEPAKRNYIFEPGEGDMPLPGLAGIKGLMDKGAMVCVCNMAYKVYSGFVAQSMGLNPEDVYNEFVENKHPGIHLAPSGVWVLGRLAENGIAYIDASVG